MDATDLDILEGWIEEVEMSAEKLAAEVAKLRTFIEKGKEEVEGARDGLSVG